ncbi:wnt family [Popillia japonica]|uniref:Protein Wnt n=1 Tax=Popillia japonica TaxID=7064 RepID=A0AAW1ICK7_POPJA
MSDEVECPSNFKISRVMAKNAKAQLQALLNEKRETSRELHRISCGSQIFFLAAGSNVALDPNQICKKSRKLRGKMAEICKNETKLLQQISHGVQLGQRECQYQFRFRKWNCTSSRRSMKKVLLRDTRETGFVNAITAAGVTYAHTL